MDQQATWTAILLLLAVAAFLIAYWRVQEHFWRRDVERQRRRAGERDGAHPAE